MLDMECIAEMFASFEGCGLPTVKDEGFGYGFGIWNPEMDAQRDCEYQREQRKLPSHRQKRAALARNYRLRKREDINARRRASYAKKRAA